jgi:hypothetical protein
MLLDTPSHVHPPPTQPMEISHSAHPKSPFFAFFPSPFIFSIEIHKSTSNKGSRKWVRVWGPIVTRKCYIV